MNKKQKEILRAFEEAKEVAVKYSDNSVWCFLGALESALAWNSEEKGSDFVKAINEREKFAKMLTKITDGLK